MTIEKITNDMHTAMKNHDNDRKSVLSAVINTAKNMAIEAKCKDNISEEIVDKAILKEIKTVKEQIETCPADRTALADKYKTNLSILEEYAPKMLSEDEIRNIIADRYANELATHNKGTIMKAIMPELKGKADGKLINQIVSELCH